MAQYSASTWLAVPRRDPQAPAHPKGVRAMISGVARTPVLSLGLPQALEDMETLRLGSIIRSIQGGSTMTRARTLLGLVGLALAVSAPLAHAQVATVRGKVVDEASSPVPDVKLEMEFKGESRQKIVKTVVTDKKGGFVRSGLASGPYKFTFAKDGYKPYSMEVSISLGGLSEMPDVVLHAGATGAAAPAGATTGGGP